ncbi:MAG: LpxI family protein [Deltaproteobacteria bacterium]
METIGLVAGNRNFPLLFVQEAARRGVQVAAVCIRGETDRRVSAIAGKEHSLWISLAQFERAYSFFKEQGVHRVVMCGQISPYRLFSREVRESPLIQELLSSAGDKRAKSIFDEIAKRVEAQGFEVLSSTTYLEDYVPRQGTLTRRQPDAEERADIQFAMSMAKEIARLDIGLSVAVKSKAVIAVEAFEGTDRLIRRAGALAGKGFVVAKVARPGQDMRFDIPVIGLRTIQVLARSGASCLAVEAGKTLFLDRDAAIALADRKKISLVAV